MSVYMAKMSTNNCFESFYDSYFSLIYIGFYIKELAEFNYIYILFQAYSFTSINKNI